MADTHTRDPGRLGCPAASLHACQCDAGCFDEPWPAAQSMCHMVRRRVGSGARVPLGSYWWIIRSLPDIAATRTAGTHPPRRHQSDGRTGSAISPRPPARPPRGLPRSICCGAAAQLSDIIRPSGSAGLRFAPNSGRQRQRSARAGLPGPVGPCPALRWSRHGDQPIR